MVDVAFYTGADFNHAVLRSECWNSNSVGNHLFWLSISFFFFFLIFPVVFSTKIRAAAACKLEDRRDSAKMVDSHRSTDNRLPWFSVHFYPSFFYRYFIFFSCWKASRGFSNIDGGEFNPLDIVNLSINTEIVHVMRPKNMWCCIKRANNTIAHKYNFINLAAINDARSSRLQIMNVFFFVWPQTNHVSAKTTGNTQNMRTHQAFKHQQT